MALRDNLVAAKDKPELLRFLLAKAVRRIKMINHRKIVRIELDPIGDPHVAVVLETMVPNREFGEVEQEPEEAEEVAS